MPDHKAKTMSYLPTALFVGILLSILTCGCTTTEKSIDVAIERTHFSLIKGDAVTASNELPVYYPIWVVWYRGEVEVSRELGYRGWDFNGDGRIDLVEMVTKGESPAVTARVYDFNFDGTVDLHEEYAQKLEAKGG